MSYVASCFTHAVISQEPAFLSVSTKNADYGQVWYFEHVQSAHFWLSANQIWALTEVLESRTITSDFRLEFQPFCEPAWTPCPTRWEEDDTPDSQRAWKSSLFGLGQSARSWCWPIKCGLWGRRLTSNKSRVVKKWESYFVTQNVHEKKSKLLIL